jgi:hypothetical protein
LRTHIILKNYSGMVLILLGDPRLVFIKAVKAISGKINSDVFTKNGKK